ncbi:TIGR02302 family protein [Roseomonas haemaphysalidis]|uniref:TIGR02302 family protein n=1 Tax=Roseomonas haemaphysalidis TaxID=2768162 RepID=A0ABS3KJ44_9PROT|nr:TIGR02302 family protein [Roseomonas haemaphysalidis]MBO1077460.1 TIGR02302 family protein [Roseomonas haemaphysalidis]
MTDPSRDPLSRRLARGRRLARWALLWEAAWPRLWPVLGVAGLFLACALAGLFLLLPGWLHLLLLAGFAAALGWAVWRGLRGFVPPGAAAADRRLEAATGLRHRPLATLTDTPATTDPAALALWQAHRQRAGVALSRLRVGSPRPGLAALDRRALRLGLLVALTAAFGMAGSEAPERLRRALSPGFGAPAATPALRLEAWISPPAYTGAAPVFLPPAGGAATVPAGSRLQVAFSGGRGGVPELRLGEAATPFKALDGSSFTAEAVLDAGTAVSVHRDGQEVARWTLATQADAAPTVAFAEPPAPAQRGLAIRLPWRAEDDWGIARVQAEIRLGARPDAAPILLELPLPGGNARAPRGVAQPDLSAHPWAGLPVRVRLLAQDTAGQRGQSDSAELVLPERSFTHPVARELAGLRKSLSLDPLARPAVARDLDRLAMRPDAFENDLTTFLALRSARFRLTFDQQPEAVPATQELMWQTAIALEEGRAGRTARALAEARQALREALAEAERTPPDAAQRQELERRVEALREAVRQHLEALAEQLQRENGETMPQDPQARMMDPQELQRRTQEMQDAAREGRTDDLQRELAELEQMLDALQNGQMARREGGSEQSRRRQQQRQQGQQQMGAIQDMVRREGEMLDRSGQRGQSAEQQRQEQRRQRQPQASPDAAARQAEAQRDARQQRALRRALGELMQQFGDLTGEVPEALGRADQAMREAQEALGQGGDASPHQQQAIRELQEGAQQMAQSMQQQFGEGQQEGEGQGQGQGQANGDGREPGNQRNAGQARGQNEGRDPLGRPSRTEPNSNDPGSDTVVPGEAEALRTRQLQEELRRRGGERERPPGELDYIDRLLKTF